MVHGGALLAIGQHALCCGQARLATAPATLICACSARDTVHALLFFVKPTARTFSCADIMRSVCKRACQVGAMVGWPMVAAVASRRAARSPVLHAL